MKTLADLQKNTRKEVRKELIKKGADPDKIRDKDIIVLENGKELVFKYGDISLSMPAPSQEAIDSWWKVAGPTIVGGLVALAGVVVTKVLDKVLDKKDT